MSRLGTWLMPGLTLLASWMAVSCTGPALDAAVYACSLDEDCGAGWYCVNGQCRDTSPAALLGYQQILASGQTFTMGSPSGELGRVEGEDQHRVTLTHNFWLKSTEVTQREWSEVMGTSPSHFASCGDTCPVDSVSWFDAVEYVNTLSDLEGLPRCYTGESFVGLDCRGYRLPTEAEWEFAARAGTTTATYNGDLQSTECSDAVVEPIAWYCGNSNDATHAVAQKAANGNGLHDMLGNVWEWVHDWYGPYEGDATGPTGPPGGDDRVIRGGGWSRNAQVARAAYRFSSVPDDRNYVLGFRPARSMP